jgi:hypothetical protein
MVEEKRSIYDSETAPLVQAEELREDPHQETPRVVEATRVEDDGTSSSSSTAGGNESVEVSEAQVDRESLDKARVVGAGTASAVLGLLLCGPIGAALLGFGAAYAAENKEGVVGDAARAIGDVALQARDRAVEIDRKHRVVDKSKKAASEAWDRAKEADRKHRILERARDFAVCSWTATADFCRRHNLVERGVNGIGKGVCWVLEKLAGGNGRTAPQVTSTPPTTTAATPAAAARPTAKVC